jgi:hypothetical protein
MVEPGPEDANAPWKQPNFSEKPRAMSSSLRRREALTVDSQAILAMAARRRASSCGSTRGSRVALSTEARTIGTAR